MTDVSWLTVRNTEHIEIVVVVGHRLIGRGASPSLPLFGGRGARLVWSADEKASLFWLHLDSKQCKHNFQ